MLREVFYGKCPACSGLSNIDEPVCSQCKATFIQAGVPCLSCGYIVKTEGAYCPKCSNNITFYGDKIFSCYKYTGAIRSLLLSIKFNYNFRGGLYLHKIINIPENMNLDDYDIITYIPSHFLRNFRRIKHPAKIISDYFNDISNKNKVRILKKNRYTKFQYKLNPEERKNNIKNSFNVCKDINMLKILLVDDIFTTGSTLNECAKLLKSAGASLVDCFVIAVD